MRELGQLAAAKTLAAALPYIRGVSALGLASAELGNPPEAYKDVYNTGGLLGLHKVAHAGAAMGMRHDCHYIMLFYPYSHSINAVRSPQEQEEEGMMCIHDTCLVSSSRQVLG
jgi:adenosine deaminase